MTRGLVTLSNRVAVIWHGKPACETIVLELAS
jgi:hypothetical protein